MRLNLYLAKSGICSRRKADDLIKAGKVIINQHKILEPFYQVKDNDHVEVENQAINPSQPVYFIFNKPKGVTTTLDDPHAAEKISEYFPANTPGLFPVGRLDRESSGLIILTNDGDLCYSLTHPKFEIEKEYIAKLAGFFTLRYAENAKKGIIEHNELLKVKAITILSRSKKESRVKVTITEGKKRHLRRLFQKLGFGVIDLKRIRIGRLLLKDLKPGEYMPMSAKGLYKLVLGQPI